jgi:hypothetical protein
VVLREGRTELVFATDLGIDSAIPAKGMINNPPIYFGLPRASVGASEQMSRCGNSFFASQQSEPNRCAPVIRPNGAVSDTIRGNHLLSTTSVMRLNIITTT